ncbi:MAG: DHH family phosphoesterase [Planctomycetota bacterium]
MTDQKLTIDWSRLQPILDQYQRFVLTSHVNPDCDALGSELGMAGLLDALGKEVRIVNADPTPPRLSFVDPDHRIEVLGRGVDQEDLRESDVIVVLDTSVWSQLGKMAEVVRNLSKQLVVIDHHASEGQLPALVLKDSRAEATGSLIFRASRFFGVALTPGMASALFAAIATDTGWFRFASTTSSTFFVISQLMAYGAAPSEIYRELYERDSMGRVKLRGMVLSRLTTELDGQLAHTHVRARDFIETGAVPSETEDFVNMALVIDGIEVAVMLTEQPVGTFKLSLRSRGMVDCSQLAVSLGGGGHKAAAGATLKGSFETVERRVLDTVRHAMRGARMAT